MIKYVHDISTIQLCPQCNHIMYTNYSPDPSETEKYCLNCDLHYKPWPNGTATLTLDPYIDCKIGTNWGDAAEELRELAKNTESYDVARLIEILAPLFEAKHAETLSKWNR